MSLIFNMLSRLVIAFLHLLCVNRLHVLDNFGRLARATGTFQTCLCAETQVSKLVYKPLKSLSLV